MANTYQLIASITSSGSTNSVTFSSIPATYTDLLIKTSTRTTRSGFVTSAPDYYFNGINTGAKYSYTYIYGTGSSAASSNGPTQQTMQTDYTSTNSSTANTFGNQDIYIPNYTGTAKKPTGSFGVAETNATTQYMSAYAGLADVTTAITSITLTATFYSWVDGSTFYLYGIKNT